MRADNSSGFTCSLSGPGLAFCGAVETLEGAPVDWAVILAFVSVAEAHALYDSALYQQTPAAPAEGAHYRAFIIEGATT